MSGRSESIITQQSKTRVNAKLYNNLLTEGETRVINLP